MDNDDLVRLDNRYLVEDETYVVNSDDVLEEDHISDSNLLFLEEENNSDSNCGGKNAPLREQDRFLPIANIAKIMKRAIPENGKIAKDARECLQECISEFISFITSEASDHCQVEKRKTINGEDVLYAMNTLGFDNYVEPLKLYLKKYREIVLTPVTVTKLSNKTLVLYEEGGATGLTSENESEAQSESAVIYTYPKVIGDFTIS